MIATCLRVLCILLRMNINADDDAVLMQAIVARLFVLLTDCAVIHDEHAIKRTQIIFQVFTTYY